MEVTIELGEGQYQQVKQAQSANSMIKEMAADLGIDGVGISDSSPLQLARNGFETAIKHGFIPAENAPRPKTLTRLTTPAQHLKRARSIVSAYESYDGGEPDVADHTQGVIAPYTRSNYYGDLKRRLERLAALIEKTFGARSRIFSCYVTLAEKPIAHRAGLGFYGKNGIIITPEYGSFVVLGEIVTDLEIEPDQPLDMSCGQCTLCMDACPTRAIVMPHFVDRARCIQYISERRGVIPTDTRELWRNRLYGCSTCQDICPQNSGVRPVARAVADGFVGPSLPLADVIGMGEDAFQKTFAGNQIGMRERNAIRRNAVVAAGSIRLDTALPAITQAIEDPDPMIRQHSLWALARIRGPAARSTLERALKTEAETCIRDEIKTLLD
jgi:epoxyqueuosine reductase